MQLLKREIRGGNRAMKTKLLILIPFLAVFPRIAWSDGGIFWPRYAPGGTTPKQRAIIFHDKGEEIMVLQMAFEGRTSELAWVIPTPSRPRVGTASSGMFNDLFRLTQPRTGYRVSTPSLCGAAKEEVSPTEEGDVTVWEKRKVGIYETVVLTATDSKALIDWLNLNGFTFPETALDAVNHYIGKGWYFVGVKIGADVPVEEGNPDPIRLDFKSERAIYPLRISSISASRRTEILLYIFSDHRMEPQNYGIREVDVSDMPKEDPGSEYERRVRQAIYKAGGRAFVVEYAKRLWWEWFFDYGYWADYPIEGKFLTRLRSVMSGNEMDQDIILAPAKEDKELRIIFLSSSKPDRALNPLVSIGLLFLISSIIALKSWNIGRWWVLATIMLGLAVI